MLFPMKRSSSACSFTPEGAQEKIDRAFPITAHDAACETRELGWLAARGEQAQGFKFYAAVEAMRSWRWPTISSAAMR